MEFVKGISVVAGIAIGKVLVLDVQDFLTHRRFIYDKEIPAEIQRFRDAVTKTVGDLSQLRDKVDSKVGEELALIFQAHIGILQDKIFQEDVENYIREQLLSAEYAVSTELRKLEKALRSVSDEYLSQRATDITDIGKRLQFALAGAEAQRLGDLEEPVIIVARDLAPTQLAAFDHNKIAGVAMDRGGLSSHTSILLRAFEIPSVIGLEKISTDVSSDEMAIIDGGNGIVILRPNDQVLEKYRKKQGEYFSRIAKLKKESLIPAVTQDGKRVHVTANIEFPEEIDHALESGLEGIGLYRTEYLYLTQDTEPTEEDHFTAYKKAVQSLNGKPITLRTLDLGADKYFSKGVTQTESNPFLGFRSVRMFLSGDPEVMKRQLRAMLRASIYGEVKILFPMISNMEEIHQAKAIYVEVQEELNEMKIPFSENVKIGVMVEVPSIAMISDIAAQEVDFFSIGTNDLIQFTMAVDRTNDKVSYLYQPHDISILRLVRTVIDNAHINDIQVSMCGEMSGDPINTILLLGMGLDEFSVAPASGPIIKHILRNVSMKDAKAVAEKSYTMIDHNELFNFLRNETNRLVPDIDFAPVLS